MTADFDFTGISDLYDSLSAGGQGAVYSDADTTGRRIVIVLIDVSASMAFPYTDGSEESRRGRARRERARPRRRIDVLNERLRAWLPLMRDQGRGHLREAEMAVITFGGRGVHPVTGDSARPRDTWHTDGGVFVPLAELDLGELEAFGTTPLAAAIGTALDLADARVRYLARRHVAALPVRILMFGDGGSYDRSLPADSWRSAAARVAALRQQHMVQFFAFGAPGADEPVLRAIAGEGYVPLLESGFENLLDLILRTTTADEPFEAIRDQFGWSPAGETADGGAQEEGAE